MPRHVPRTGGPALAERPDGWVRRRAASRTRGVSRRSLLRGVGVGAGALALGACGTPGSGGAGGGTGLSVVDQRGRRIELAGPVRRLVTIVIPAASMVAAIDSGVDHLVGMNSSAAKAIQDGVLGKIFPTAARIPGDVADDSFAPNVESIVALDPDVVVQWGDRGSEIIAPLENAGVRVLGLRYGTQQDLETWIGLFGTLLGKPDRAAALVGRMHDRLAAIRSAQPAGAGKPKILYFNRMRGGMTIGGNGSYTDFYINLVGGTNPAAGLSSQASVSAEQVLAWDPDVVLVGNFDSATPEDVYGNPVWQGMSAVRSRRVYKVPLGGYRWDPPCAESPLMWQWLRSIAYPEAGAGQLRAQMHDDYRFLYNYDLTDVDVDRILWTDLNAGSANYRRLYAG
ncbi:MAG: iron complex transport system substrate-binding protein [Pseudonocardiales bacterium]|nr:iron complex transport system substrate-binding protein [Pseudonocardiales bacterium]